MIIHVLINVPQETRRNDADRAKRNTRQIDPFVALRKGNLTRSNHHGVGRLVALNAGDELEVFQERSPRERDGFADVSGVFDAELEYHGAADEMFGIRDEFVDEDVVVSGVADRAANDSDREGEGRDSSDEILYRRIN